MPTKTRRWQYSNTKGGLQSNLVLNPEAELPHRKPSQHLVAVIATALNPVDYKPAEIPVFGTLMIPKPATPGIDFAGYIITPAADSQFKVGDLVFGAAGSSPFAAGALSEYAVVEEKTCTAIPRGLDPLHSATIAVAGITAYQSIVPMVKAGDSLFINGGSGGVGVFGIQIAKLIGCHVTTTCSSANVELCKSLGADIVIDYKRGSVLEALLSSNIKFDHVVDNVGLDKQLWWRCHEYTSPKACLIMVGGEPSFARIADSLKRKLVPVYFGGIKRQIKGFWPTPDMDHLKQIGTWMVEGRIKPVIDETFPFEQAPQAFSKLRTGRARGKIVVDVASKTWQESRAVIL